VHDLKAYLRRAGQAAQRSHRHDFWQIIAFKGNGSHHVDLQSHRYRTGTLLILASGAVHKFCGTNTQGLMLHFPAAFFSRGADDASRLLRLRAIALETPIVTPAPSDRDRLRALMQEFRDEANRSPEDKLMQQNMLHTLALLLLRNSPNSSEARQDYIRLLECIEKHYTERPTISELARALQVSTKRLFAIAATGSGVSPGKLVDQRLVLEAKRRLIHSSEPISSIGFALGFADPAYFSRFFRKHAGQSPRDFRNQPG